MNISQQFNKFYHSAVLKDLFYKSHELVFREYKDTRTNESFAIRKYEDYSDIDELKQLLKILNLNYKVDEKADKKISTCDIETKALLEHIEWVIELGTRNGIELNFVREQWDRLIQLYNRG